MDRNTIHTHFPMLTEPQLLAEIEQEGHLMQVEEGDRIIDLGSYIKVVPLFIEGSASVYRPDDKGQEIFLYHLEPGDTCAVSLNGCITGGKSRVRADANEESSLLGIPAPLMDQWMSKYTSWRNFVFSTYAKRFNELLFALDEIAFTNLDERLTSFLEKRAKVTGNATINLSHQEIALALHSSREVISRLLKKMERNGMLALARNKIMLKKATH